MRSTAGLAIFEIFEACVKRPFEDSRFENSLAGQEVLCHNGLRNCQVSCTTRSQHEPRCAQRQRSCWVRMEERTHMKMKDLLRVGRFSVRKACWALFVSANLGLVAYGNTFGRPAALPVQTVTHYVWQDSPNPTPPYTNWDTAAHIIQDAVDVALPGEKVCVTNGVYATGGRAIVGTMTNRVAIDRPITVESCNGRAFTLIVGAAAPEGGLGEGAIRCAYLGTNAVLSGFTLTNGWTAGGWYDGSEVADGGGVWSEFSGVVTNCLFTGNRAGANGGGAHGGILLDCVLTKNRAEDGGGGGAHQSILAQCQLTWNFSDHGCGAATCTLDQCTLAYNLGHNGGGAGDSVLNRCTLSHNVSDYGGGAIWSRLNACTLTGNSAVYGGGASWSTLDNCVLQGNHALIYGGGVYRSTVNNSTLTSNEAEYGGGAVLSTLHNCTVTDNRALVLGGGAYQGCTLRNSILYHNTVRGVGANYWDSTLDFCCATPLPTSGAGNIDSEPQLASSSHLSAASPCRSGGSALYASGLDIDGETWAESPSMGCDEYWGDSATGPLSVAIESAYTNVAVGFLVEFTAQIEGRVIASRWEFGDGTVVSNRPSATHGWTTPGVYRVVLRAYNATSPDGVSATVTVHVAEVSVHYVAADSATPQAPYLSWETAARTIQEAVDEASVVGALVSVTNGSYARVVVDKPIRVQGINGPMATVIDGEGAGRCVTLADGAVLSGFTLTNGTASDGGGVWCESASEVVSNCMITGNSADWGGGANGGTLISCTLSNNSADHSGGAVSVRLYNCLIISNLATRVCGVHWGSLNNCTVTGNSASQAGGGVSVCTIYNSIVYYNTAPTDPNGSSSEDFNYSCTTPLPANGVGNIDLPPGFVEAAAGNYRLSLSSPCINAGTNQDWMIGAVDLDGNPRIVQCVVDMGAYEAQRPNEPPQCDAQVSCALSLPGQPGLFVLALNGSNACLLLAGSGTDPDGDPLHFVWTWDATNTVAAPWLTSCLNVGCHTATLTVSDGPATCSAMLHFCVITPCEAVAQCIALVDRANFDRKNKRPLIASLEAACTSLDRGDLTSGLSQLESFQNKVRAQIVPRWPADAKAILDCAHRIIDAIDCTSHLFESSSHLQ